VPDVSDAFPLDPLESKDSDGINDGLEIIIFKTNPNEGESKPSLITDMSESFEKKSNSQGVHFR